MQRPDSEDIIDLEFFLLDSKSVEKDQGSDTADEKRTDRMHQVGTRANGNQTGQGAVVYKAGVILAGYQGEQHATDHGCQRVDRHQSGDSAEALSAHDIKAKPANG